MCADILNTVGPGYNDIVICVTLSITSDILCYLLIVGPGSSVGKATDYGMDGPWFESRWGEILRPSRPALGLTQPPVQWVPGLSRG